MSVRRRPKNWKPLIPGFWPLVATLLLAASIFGFYAALGHFTTFANRDIEKAHQLPRRSEPALPGRGAVMPMPDLSQ